MCLVSTDSPLVVSGSGTLEKINNDLIGVLRYEDGRSELLLQQV